ncbi:30S ribosomal protein S1 [Geodia barretti]|uniref:30S ribosomal protein S1 n=1 Tax=Geodia barretti TaxID=519541 RepID=A0AA35T1C4_GEOBA|nr:30S ribosomal protein S1 [Geodia barretti]
MVAQDPNVVEITDMSQLPESAFSPREYRRGDLVTGEIVRIDDEGMVISAGLKTEGIVPPQEMRTLTDEKREQMQPGSNVIVIHLNNRGPGGMAVFSYDQAQEKQVWEELIEMHKQDSELAAKVVQHNKGGLVVDWEGEGRVEHLDARIGEDARFNILELDAQREKLVLTERRIWRQLRNAAKERLLEELQEGQIVQGTVRSMRGFGAFVDLGDAEGLVPISELSWAMIKSPEEVVSVGDDLTLKVLRVDRENSKISLSLKRTQPEPWDTVPERYHVGDIVDGTVTRLMDFGAFVKLEDWVEGLVHISELSARRMEHPREIVYQGQLIKVQILSIDTERKRMSLSYRKVYGL